MPKTAHECASSTLDPEPLCSQTPLPLLSVSACAREQLLEGLPLAGKPGDSSRGCATAVAREVAKPCAENRHHFMETLGTAYNSAI